MKTSQTMQRKQERVDQKQRKGEDKRGTEPLRERT